jgi:hypothetical protein
MSEDLKTPTSSETLEAYKALLATRVEGTKVNGTRQFTYDESQKEIDRQIAELKKRKKILDAQKAQQDQLWNEWFRNSDSQIEKIKTQYTLLVSKEANDLLERLKLETNLFRPPSQGFPN